MSLIFSEIKPIIDFGWMMTLGLISSFIVTFILLPTLLNFFDDKKISLQENKKSKITNFLGNLAIKNKSLVLIFAFVIIFFKCFWNKQT